MWKNDEFYMKKAIALAKRAASKDEVPVGAVLVSPYGKIISTGYNLVEKHRCQTNHAEIRAIKTATKKLNDWRLVGFTLYVTLEPCPMCLGLCKLSRIDRLVYGAKSPNFDLSIDKENINTLYTKQIKNITSGVLEKEIQELLKDFFKNKRNRSF